MRAPAGANAVWAVTVTLMARRLEARRAADTSAGRSSPTV